MRIAFLGDGSLNHVRRWAGYFHECGHDVLLISFEDVSGCRFQSRRLRKRLPTKLLGYVAALGRVRKELDAFRPDLVNALYAGGYGLIGALSGYHPLVISTLGSDLLVDYPSSPVHRAQITYSIRKADLVTTDAENLSEMAISIGAPRERILKAYFGVDENLFHPAPDPLGKNEPGSSTPRVVSTRSLFRVYNISLLIDAAPEILNVTDAQFIICGDGPQRRRLEKRAAGLGLAEKISFKDRLAPEGVARELQSASVYVSTSHSDSTSVSLLEAMACGVPPVVTDIPANREWVEDEKNGLLVPVDDPSALAMAVVKMLRDREFAGKVREKNFRTIKEKGLWETNMQRVGKAFLELAASRG